MTAIGDHCTTIRDWLNFDAYSDALITSWTRMAEEALSAALRCKHMIAVDTAEITQSRVLLPADWLELDFVRVIDGKPLHFRARDEFYNNAENDPNYNSRHYTITGNYLMVGGDLADGRNIEISYYEAIPPLGDTPNWLMTYYSRLYVSATMAVAKAFAVGEEESAVMWQTATKTFVDDINARDKAAASSGSKLVMPRKKGFG